jgi:hypothetical protein
MLCLFCCVSAVSQPDWHVPVHHATLPIRFVQRQEENHIIGIPNIVDSNPEWQFIDSQVDFFFFLYSFESCRQRIFEPRPLHVGGLNSDTSTHMSIYLGDRESLVTTTEQGSMAVGDSFLVSAVSNVATVVTIGLFSAGM